MEDQTNEPEVIETEVEETEVEETPEPTDDVSELKARLAKLEERAIAQRERTKMLRQELAKSKPKAEAPKQEKQTGELSETQLDYLDLKGVSDDADIDVIQKVMQRTGQTVRQALADDYVISKLAANKAKRDVQGATPSSTKRAGGQVGDVASAVAKFKDTGVLPEDRALADAVVDSIAKAGNDRLPPWQR